MMSGLPALLPTFMQSMLGISPAVERRADLLAEAVRFELTEGYQPSVLFKSTALNHSATLPVICRTPWEVAEKMQKFIYKSMLNDAMQLL
jgi:hypothetical protein